MYKQRVIKRAVVITLLVPAAFASAAPKQAKPAPQAKQVPDDLQGPAPEAIANPAKVALPPVPAFELPASEPGFHGPRELRVHGRGALGTDIKVKGYVTWSYDCAAVLAAANPKSTRAQIQASINSNPALCEYPKFYLGDARDTARDASIWIVNLPRAPKTPKVTAGDYVTVTGTWTVSSPTGEHNTDGLLVFKAVERATPAAAAPAAAPAPALPEVTVTTAIPLRTPIPDETRNASIGRLNECTKQIAARAYDAAIAACAAATQTWPGNHLAWYSSASAHMGKNEWPQALSDMERTIALRPDQGMYQLYHGIALYEAERARARDAQAAKENKKPDDVVLDASQLKLEPARDALLRAIKLSPELWRAHFYLGRVLRDLDDGKHAAEQFTQTIAVHPAYRFAYVALIELYRRWDYIDAALAVAQAGTSNVAAADQPDLWFEVGMAYDAKHVDDKAIEAFSKAIAARPDDIRSKFQRGQIYARKGDNANAKRDLEDVVKSTDPRFAPAKPIAQQLLNRIAGKK